MGIEAMVADRILKPLPTLEYSPAAQGMKEGLSAGQIACPKRDRHAGNLRCRTIAYAPTHKSVSDNMGSRTSEPSPAWPVAGSASREMVQRAKLILAVAA
jgi:hypothetical protein